MKPMTSVTTLTDDERQMLLILIDKALSIPCYPKERERLLGVRHKLEGVDKRIEVHS